MGGGRPEESTSTAHHSQIAQPLHGTEARGTIWMDVMAHNLFAAKYAMKFENWKMADIQISKYKIRRPSNHAVYQATTRGGFEYCMAFVREF